ncbi:MAG: cytochrome c [Anaerolineales bacterium]|nr:cytochrome c [Anaerolineales bacterium]
MLADVRVLSAEDYASWRSDILAVASLPPAEQGQRLWENNCASCHSVDGSTVVGPTWQGIYGEPVELADGTTVTVDDAYIKQSIYDPNSQIVAGFQPNLMPQNYQSTLSDQDVANIIEFIKTLTPP